MTLSISVEKREISKKSSKKSRLALAAQGKIPAVVYGKQVETTPITIDRIAFKKIWQDAGESSVVNLDGLGQTVSVLIHEVMLDPIKNEPIHADFHAIEMNKPVQVAVELVFEGEAPAEKELGGTLTKVMHEIEIEALPKDLPSEIIVDISTLVTFDDVIHASDIKLPNGVTLITDPEEAIALVDPANEVIEETVPETDLSAIEVEQKGKKDEEEGAAEE